MPRAGTAKDQSPRNNFFPGMKRKLRIDRWNPKHNGEAEKRVLIEFELPLSGQQIIGHPEFIKDTFATMEKEGSVEKRSELAMLIQGMSIEFFDLPENLEKIHTLHEATFQSFELFRKADGESHITVLRFSATVLRTIPLLILLHERERTDLWAMFEATQGFIEPKPTDQMKLGEDKELPAKSEEPKKKVN
jgi:hypothetical protein